MYSARMVAQKTHTSQAAVRYFARKYRLAKITIAGKAVFVFDEKDYRLFRRYIKSAPKKKEQPKQLTFSFFNECAVLEKAPPPPIQQKKKEAALLQTLCRLLQAAGKSGMDKAVIQTCLKLDKHTLQQLLNKHTSLPIAEDDSIDNNLYWVGIPSRRYAER